MALAQKMNAVAQCRSAGIKVGSLDMKDMKEDASRRQWEILKEAEEKENRVGRRSVAVALWK